MLRKKTAKAKIKDRINEYCYHELKKVEVRPKVGLFNFKCFYNACEYASKNKGCEVILGIYIDKASSTPNLHFWCRDKNGNDLEVSMGYLSSEYNYYEIKVVKISDYNIINGVFSDAMDYYREKLTTPWERFLIGKDRVL
ncbi:MAG: hypothetical protein K0U78_15055 [Actinomycetia bacterium]|nr:hypothetical protein [Actinomycetes bacterium]